MVVVVLGTTLEVIKRKENRTNENILFIEILRFCHS
jgi:hypothetical protein